MIESTPQLNAAIAKAKTQFEQVLASKKVDFKTGTGRQIKFNYAEHEEIAEAVTPALSANGLAVVSQMVILGERLVLITTLRHESGEAIASYFPLPSDIGDDPKTLGASISYGRRYNTLCLLDITTIDPSNETERAEQVRKLAKDIKQEAGFIKKPEPIQKPGAYKPTGLPTGYKPQKVEPQAEPQSQNNGLYPRNNKIVNTLLKSLGFAQSRFDSWFNQKFPGSSVDMLSHEDIKLIIKAICKSYATERNNLSAIQAIDNTIISRMNLDIDFQMAINDWVSSSFLARAANN